MDERLKNIETDRESRTLEVIAECQIRVALLISTNMCLLCVYDVKICSILLDNKG